MNEEVLKKEIVKRLGIEALPDEEQNELIDQVNEALITRIVFETMEKLPEDKVDEFKSMLESETTTAEEVDKYIRDNIENYDEFLGGVVESFFKDMEKSIKEGEDNSSEENN